MSHMPALILVVHSDITYAFLVLILELLDVFIFFHPLTKTDPISVSRSQASEENIMPDNWLNVASWLRKISWELPALQLCPIKATDYYANFLTTLYDIIFWWWSDTRKNVMELSYPCPLCWVRRQAHHNGQGAWPFHNAEPATSCPKQSKHHASCWEKSYFSLLRCAAASKSRADH